jgi:hypothetical protein
MLKLTISCSALLLGFSLLAPSLARAGGLEGRIDSRIVGSTSTENITNGYRNINLIKESRSSWAGESLTSQTTSNMTLQLDGLLTSSLSRIEETQDESLQPGGVEQVTSMGRGLVRELVRMEDPVINISTSTGTSQSRITASGTDYSWMNAHFVDTFNSSSSSSSFGGESSTFGQTF